MGAFFDRRPVACVHLYITGFSRASVGKLTGMVYLVAPKTKQLLKVYQCHMTILPPAAAGASGQMAQAFMQPTSADALQGMLCRGWQTHCGHSQS